jgi:hypothetical protein
MHPSPMRPLPSPQALHRSQDSRCGCQHLPKRAGSSTQVDMVLRVTAQPNRHAIATDSGATATLE